MTYSFYTIIWTLSILISILIILSISSLIFVAFNEEKSITTIRTSYERSNFPKTITYKNKKGLIVYRIDLHLNENTIRKYPLSEKYYAEYKGKIHRDSFKFK